jgi:hypothetical protein
MHAQLPMPAAHDTASTLGDLAARHSADSALLLLLLLLLAIVPGHAGPCCATDCSTV